MHIIDRKGAENPVADNLSRLENVLDNPLPINDSFPDEENVLIQGIIDLFFIEDGKIVLLDYKTDNVAKIEDLSSRYHTQLDYYEESLQRIINIPVGEKLIYSFKFDELLKL